MPPAPDVCWVPGLPLRDAALQVAVHPGGREQPASPFVALSPGGRYAQVLLARLALADGTAMRHVALKLPAPGWRPPSPGWTLATIDNAEVAAMWERERVALRELRHPSLASGIDLTGGAWMPPVHYCRSQRRFFTPPSPSTGGRLEVCLDEALLREAGLASPTAGQDLYLFDPEQENGPRTFYTWSATAGDAARSGFLVRRRTELYRDLGRLLERERHGDLDSARRERLAADLPCVGCSQRESCYPAQAEGALPAEQELLPLTFLPGPVLCTDAAELTFDEFCHLLGGARREQAGATAPAGRRVLWDLWPSTPRAEAYHHGGDLGPEWFAEVLLLKLGAVQQVVDGVLAFHQGAGRPHLGLAPDNVTAQVLPSAPGVPSRWSFRVRLQDLGCQHRNGTMPGRDVWVPAVDVPPSILAAEAEVGQFCQELTMTCTLQALADDAGQPALLVELRSQGTRVQGVRPGDHLRFDPHAAIPGLGDLALVGEVLTADAGGAKGRLQLPAGAGPDRGALPLRTAGTATFLRRLGSGSDLTGLGMLLLHALLVHDERDFFAAEDLVRAMCERLELAVAGVEEPDRAYVSATASNLLEEAHLLPTEVLYQAEDRAALRRHALTPALAQIWVGSLQLMLRALTPLQGFGMSGDRDPVAAFGEALQDLRRRLRVELFGQAGRDRSVGRVCDEMLAEVNQRLYGAEAQSGSERQSGSEARS